MWRELIRSLDPATQFFEKANRAQIMALEAGLQVKISEDIKTLLQESNGVRDQYGFCIIWSVDEISKYNREMRTFPQYLSNYKPFDNLLFFADAGNGDRFAFAVVQNEVQKEPVFSWNHENDERIVIAHSLGLFLEGWIGGQISI